MRHPPPTLPVLAPGNLRQIGLRRSRRGGFTLLEILVASGLMAVLVGLVLAVTFTAVEAWNRATGSLTAVQQARAAVDLIQQDLETAVFMGEGADATLVYEEQAVPGRSEAAPSGYLRFLARPLDRDGDGVALAGLAWQVAVANPLRPNAAEGRLPALYRGRMGGRELLARGGLDRFPTATAAAFSMPAADAFVAGGVVRLTVRFGISVQAADGTRHPYILQVTDPGPAAVGERIRVLPRIAFPLEDFAADEVAEPVRVLAPDWIEVAVVVLPEDAMRLLEAAETGLAAGPEATWERIVERQGARFVRRVAIPARGW